MTSTGSQAKAPSGNVETAFMLKFEPQYIVAEAGAEIVDGIGPTVVKCEASKRRTFLRVAEWKAVGALPTIEEIDSDDIEYVTAVALDEGIPNHLRLPFLQILPGVSRPLASTLLTVFNPRKFSILDSRSVGVLDEFDLIESDNPAPGDYQVYRKLMKSLATGTNCAPIDLHRALITDSRQPKG